MIERGEESLETIQDKYTKMWWKWADKAVEHQLRIENWPTALRDIYPSAGFALANITENAADKPEKKARSKALKRMYEQMKAAYENPNGEEAESAAKIVSWTPGKTFCTLV